MPATILVRLHTLHNNFTLASVRDVFPNVKLLKVDESDSTSKFQRRLNCKELVVQPSSFCSLQTAANDDNELRGDAQTRHASAGGATHSETSVSG